MISLNEDMPKMPGRPGVYQRKPIHDPNEIRVEEWTYEAGLDIKGHPHSTASIAYVIKGKCKVLMNDQEYLLETGCYYYTPPGGYHAVTEILEPTTILSLSVPQKK